VQDLVLMMRKITEDVKQDSKLAIPVNTLPRTVLSCGQAGMEEEHNPSRFTQATQRHILHEEEGRER